MLWLALEFALNLLFGLPKPFSVVDGVVGPAAGAAELVALPGQWIAMVFAARVGGCSGGAADKVAVLCEVGEGVGLDLECVELGECHFGSHDPPGSVVGFDED